MTNSKQRMITPKKRVQRLIPYTRRLDLTRDEINALNHYKDLVNPQYTWHIKVKRAKDIGIDCQIINGVLRGDYLYEKLTTDDKRKFTKCVNLINAAIDKSTVPKTLDLYKGVKNFDELSDYTVGARIPQLAFSSFTTSTKKARSYSGKNSDKRFIFFHTLLRKGKNALYVDSDEEEWILGTGCTFQVLDVEKGMIEGVRAIIYHLEVTT